MPTFTVTTKSSEQVWKSPDGQRTISKVVLDINGEDMNASTYSKAIAEVGFSGEVETYEKSGKYGVETFVKQLPKENPSYGGSQASPRTGGGKPQGDSFTMYLSYAKDLAVALLATKEGFDEGKYGELLSAVSAGGESLYEAHNKPEPKEAPPAVAKQLDKVFNDIDNVTIKEEDIPWKES